MLVASDVTYGAGSREILKGLNLSVKPGEITTVLGPNGAGKSTFLKAISGELVNAKGEVTYNGKKMKGLPVAQLAKTRAVLSQNFQVSFPFSVEEIVMMGRMPHKKSDEDHEGIAREVMNMTDVLKFASRNFNSLSGGEQQRVQLARVLCQLAGDTDTPKYLLLDEPTSNMDLSQQQQVFEIVKEVCGKNIGVFAVIHDINIASRFSDKMLFIKSGEQVAYGATDDVFNKCVIESTYSHPVRMLRCPDTKCHFVMPEACGRHKNMNQLRKTI
ncbi:heme ABC transporter ATP-binding protein [Aureibacter tunicatorum]|uniref:Iron complex transport system ATP-binding protein n=1 Tax=Aureibacter tunicatorum TaxID=866807 RepID=A0AAE3XL66_9BACT|nr:heme ABC transporter ATP-binding protein [Aureibacter tunicatorum]MDR6238019.1 iron complex transport system ATP-binding protein [Aureibacter tunicatorum]BDD03052.1 hemin import ATP-binding protein HmuV [Aureibacter tunicatorum]